MADKMQPVALGELRDRVVFCKVADVIDEVTKLSVKQMSETDPVFAAIRPFGTQQFYDNFNTEAEITHKIFVRYRSDSHMYDRIIQKIYTETKETQQLIFQIVRSTEWMGMRIFSQFDVKLLSKITA